MTAAVVDQDITDAPLAEGQWRIEDITLGPHTKYPIATWPDVSFAEIDTQDARIPRDAGITFGVDSPGANTITFEGAVFSDDLEFDLARLAKWWRGHPVRNIPGAVIPLRYCYEGRQRQVFGRPRNFAPIPGPTTRRWVDFVADFACVDDKFYSAREFSHRIPSTPPSLGGFVTPLVAPLVMTGSSETISTEFTVGGTTDAWVTLELHGPIGAPEIDLYGGWTQRMPRAELAHDQVLDIRSAPWQRRISLDGRYFPSGEFDQQSRKLSALTIPPGPHEITLRGKDPTGTAYLDVRWHETHLVF